VKNRCKEDLYHGPTWFFSWEYKLKDGDKTPRRCKSSSGTLGCCGILSVMLGHAHVHMGHATCYAQWSVSLSYISMTVKNATTRVCRSSVIISKAFNFFMWNGRMTFVLIWLTWNTISNLRLSSSYSPIRRRWFWFHDRSCPKNADTIHHYCVFDNDKGNLRGFGLQKPYLHWR